MGRLQINMQTPGLSVKCINPCPSPQMEGANLYDVFQKISKGKYEPLPADQFSPTLRKLVTGMLHVDPAGVV